MNKRNLLIAAVVLAVTALLYFGRSEPERATTGAALANVVVPDLSSEARAGEVLFNRTCAKCHGKNAAGQDGVAPPLVHKIYEPGHHGDASFHLAAKNGVRAHHWPFGNMPPVEGVSEQELGQIVFYVRELQRANGVY